MCEKEIACRGQLAHDFIVADEVYRRCKRKEPLISSSHLFGAGDVSLTELLQALKKDLQFCSIFRK